METSSSSVPRSHSNRERHALTADTLLPFWRSFLTHYKVEAGSDARYLSDLIRRMTGCPAYLDSADLVDLRARTDQALSKVGKRINTLCATMQYEAAVQSALAEFQAEMGLIFGIAMESRDKRILNSIGDVDDLRRAQMLGLLHPPWLQLDRDVASMRCRAVRDGAGHRHRADVAGGLLQGDGLRWRVSRGDPLGTLPAAGVSEVAADDARRADGGPRRVARRARFRIRALRRVDGGEGCAGVV